MGILQGVFLYLQKSAGKIVRAIFGWAVNALFTTVSENEKTAISLLVGAAAAWPLLLLGIPFPKLAALVLAFVPIPRWVSSGWIRAVWILAAVAVPVAVGTALARRRPAPRAQSRWATWLSGFPVTLAIAAAFLTAFVTAPIRRLIALARRREDLTIPLVVERDAYGPGAESVRATLESAGLAVVRGDPPWLLTAPSRVLRALGGRALKDQMPEELYFYSCPSLDVVVVPAGVTLQGEKKVAARAHGLLCEAATFGPGLQTVALESQEVERRIKDVWAVFAREPERHRGSPVLRGAVAEVSRALAGKTLDFDDWQILYREVSQISRAIEGEPQILEEEKEKPMEEDVRNDRAEHPSGESKAWPPRPGESVRSLPTSALITGLTGELRELVAKEIDLARTEWRMDWKAELRSARWFGVSAILALGFVNMLFVAAALWLGTRLAPPVAALVVGGVLLLGAAAMAWLGKSALKKPLETTRKTLREGASWARKRVA